jgi:hypothetical protein
LSRPVCYSRVRRQLQKHFTRVSLIRAALALDVFDL